MASVDGRFKPCQTYLSAECMLDQTPRWESSTQSWGLLIEEFCHAA
jgi:hypothetical protein